MKSYNSNNNKLKNHSVLIMSWVYTFIQSFFYSCLFNVALWTSFFCLTQYTFFKYRWIKYSLLTTVLILLFTYYILKIRWVYNSIRTCFIICNGEKINGILQAITESRWGLNTNIYFFYKYEYEKNMYEDKYMTGCLSIDLNVLDIKYIQGKYIISDLTVVPIVIYKGHSVVLNNDCGFYDVAHYKGLKSLGNYF